MLRLGMGLLLAGVLGAVASASPAQTEPAQPKRHGAYDTAAFAEVPALEAPELSPSGKAIAAKIAVEGKQYFSVLPLESGEKRYFSLGDADLNWWRWVNDEWLVLGVGQLVPVQGDEWYVSRAISVNARTGTMVRLNGRSAAQDADDVIWVANDGTPRILMGSQTSIYTQDAGFWPQVEEIDVSNGRRKVVVSSKEGVMSWFADGGGTVRMGIGASLDGRNRRLLYRDHARTSFRTVDRARTHRDTLTVPAMFLKEPGKAVMIADDADGYSALYEMDLATLQRGRQLFASKGYDIGGLVSDADGYEYLGVRLNENRPEVRWFDPAMKAMHAEVAARIKGGDPRIVSLNRDRSVAIIQAGSADAPGGYFVYRAADKSLEFVLHNNSVMKMARLHPVRTIRYKARDGLEIAAVLTLPRGKGRDLPLIVMPHGGPFARDAEEWDWWTQFLADRGYAVVQPNYRGSSGYGTEFTERGQGQWGMAMQDDLNDAVATLAEQGIADPKRVCMVGASYGGYAAMRAAQRDGDRFRCAVSFAGVSDLNRMLNHNSRFLGSGARRDWLRMQAPDLKSVSPVNFPEQFSIPMLLVHGTKDRVVPAVQSRMMAQRLKSAGKNATYIEQPLADHHFTRSEDRLEFLKALETFLARHNPA